MGNPPDLSSLTSGRLLAKNTILNLLGQGAPLLAALFAIPAIISGLGMERFGVLALVWVFIGYFSLFDLGMGRSLTHSLAGKLGAGQLEEIPSLVWTALGILFLLGLLGMLGGLLLTPLLVHTLLKIPPELWGESLDAFRLIAASIPIVISTAGLQGILEAYQRFGILNAVRIPQGIFNFLGPLIVMMFSSSLYFVVAVLVTARFVTWLLYLFFCFRVIPDLSHRFSLKRALVRPLVVFGSWITVSNIVSPLMVYFDRFLIGVMMGTTAVAYYATPYEMVTRLRAIPVALVGVLFPAFAATHKHDPSRTAYIFTRSVSYTFLIMFPLVLLVVTFAREGLELWLGADFAHNSAFVLQILATGVLLNSLSRFPHALVQGAGRPDLTAKLHLAELVIYLPMLWWLTSNYGIIGTAIAWTARVMVDGIFLFLIVLRLLPVNPSSVWRMMVMTGAALLMMAIGAQLPHLLMKGLFLLLTLLTFVLVAWFSILAPDERRMVLRWVKVVLSPTVTR
ncbi:flippase [Candidatus Neomarinimicrobiota bacterium]